MAQTYGGYALKTGSTSSETTDAGFVTLLQQIVLQANGTGASTNVDGSINLPPGSQIVSVLPDTTVAHTSTSAAITLGSAVGGAQYLASADVKAKGRVVAVPGAVVDAWQDVGANVTLNARLALGTTTTATGTTAVNITYVQKR